jgi:hypothetical protein
MKIMGMNTSTIFLIVLLLLLAVIPARIAKSKGYSYGGFYAFGFFLFIPALIVALAIKPKHTAEDLVAYKKLLDEGVITQEEFDKKKAATLDHD